MHSDTYEVLREGGLWLVCELSRLQSDAVPIGHDMRMKLRRKWRRFGFLFQ